MQNQPKIMIIQMHHDLSQYNKVIQKHKNLGTYNKQVNKSAYAN